MPNDEERITNDEICRQCGEKLIFFKYYDGFLCPRGLSPEDRCAEPECKVCLNVPH